MNQITDEGLKTGGS